MDAIPECDNDLNYTFTWFPNGSWYNDSGNISCHNSSDHGRENSSLDVIDIAVLIICILGAAGNGIVIWLLGFRVQRNPFITYILNLGIADFGLLMSAIFGYSLLAKPPDAEFIFEVPYFLHLLMYSSSQFLLSAISIDRCVAVFFPLWHRCHRPPRLPAIVCALMWLLSFLLTTVTCTGMWIKQGGVIVHQWFSYFANAVLCLPLVTISTLALFIKVCFKQRQRRRGKLLTILLLTLAFFLLFASPLNVMLIVTVYGNLPINFPRCAMLFASLNSSVNPVIYFLVGRQRKTRSRQSLKMMLQRAFKEEEGCTEKTPNETQL